MTPYVSFIVTVYNKAHVLAAPLAALRSQQGDFTREFVFVDDGSTDNSLALLHAFAALEPNTTIISQANAGPAKATNVGLAAARGRWVKLLDADDVLAPYATELLLRACAATGARLVVGRALEISTGAAVCFPPAPGTPSARLREQRIEDALLRNPFVPSQVLLDRATALAAGGCDERVRFAQDTSLGLRMAWCLGAFAYVDADVVGYLTDVAGSVSSSPGRNLREGGEARAWFLADHPELDPWLQTLAARRAARRTRRFLAQCGAPSSARVYAHWLELRARLGMIGPDGAAFIRTCVRAMGPAA